MYNALDSYGRLVTLTSDHNLVKERLKFLFTNSKKTLLHYSNYTLLKLNGDIAGIVSVMEGSVIPEYNNNLASLVNCYDIDTSDNDENKSKRKLQSGLKAFAEANHDELYIDVLSIAKDYRGQGFILYLLDYVKAYANSKGIKKIVLLCENGKDKLLNYYIKLGFKNSGTIGQGSIPHNRMLMEI